MGCLMPELFGKAAIEARALRKTFDGVTALERLNLAVLEGEVFALAGPEGAGKTTTIKILCGELPPSEGSARVAGYDVVGEPEQARGRIGYVPARLSLHSDLSVDENLLFRAHEHGIAAETFAKRRERLLSLSRLGRFRSQLARDLPSGMRQRLALACALVHTPDILLLDEPTAALDPVGRDEFWELLLELAAPRAEKHLTALLSTADMAEAERCRRVGMMYEGRLLACGTPWEIRRGVRLELLEVVCKPLQQAGAVLRQRPQVRWVELSGNRLHIALARPDVEHEIRRALQESGVQVRSLRRIEPTLEHAFLELVGRGPQGSA